MNNKHRIAVIGLGYVGLPVALAFAEKYPVVGFDINERRVSQLQQGNDTTHEISASKIIESTVQFSVDSKDLEEATFYIITVPTPIDHAKQPDLSALMAASKTVAPFLRKDDIVVYESTVYPGAIEEVCKPILELGSQLKANNEFYIGYSPERINPGDKEHTFTTIVKVVAGDCEKSLDIIAELYGSIVEAGVYKATSIKVAEMAKVIENTQRDINIALMNELAMICNRLEIKTSDVLEAARTKWNFLDFKPGLVGGHCIGVDPYYLTYKAQQLGHHPEVILAGRRINDYMGKYIAEQMILRMIKAGSSIKERRVAIMGFTFKENCHDIRNTKVIDIIETLKRYSVEIMLYAPCADPAAVKAYYGYETCGWNDINDVDALVVAVSHDQFKKFSLEDLESKLSKCGIIVDLKNTLKNKHKENVWSI